MTDQGCMLRAYRAADRRRDRPQRRDQHLHPGPGLQLCEQPDRGRREARGAARRRVELLALQADPAQFRPDHRASPSRRCSISRCSPWPARRAACSWSSCWPTAASSSAPRPRGLFTLFGILFFLLSVAMVGIGLIGEYVGRTYQVVRARQRYFVQGNARDRGAVGRCRRRAAAHGSSSSATARSATTASRCSWTAATTWSPLFTHEDNPSEKIWFKTPAIAAARERGIPGPHAGEDRHPGVDRSGSRPCGPT